MPVSSNDDIIREFLAGRQTATEVILGWIDEVTRYEAKNPRIPIDDVVQESSVKVLERLRAGDLKKSDSLKPYVKNITRNTMIDIYRRERRYQKLGGFIEGIMADYSADGQMIRVERVKEFFAVLGRAGPECRKLWRLIIVERLPQSKVAERMGISVAAVKVRNHRCRLKVKELREAVL